MPEIFESRKNICLLSCMLSLMGMRELSSSIINIYICKRQTDLELIELKSLSYYVSIVPDSQKNKKAVEREL